MGAAGIAANQIGDPRAYCVVAIPDRAPFLMMNPRIVREGERTGFEDEGCLSLPGITVAVTRKLQVTVEWASESGIWNQEEFGGLAARIVIHELDHLRGTVILDHLSPLKRQKLKGYIAKALRMEKANRIAIAKGVGRLSKQAVDLPTAMARLQVERAMIESK